MDASTQACSINKHLLIAADESENTGRAVAYVAHMLGATKGYRISLINVVAIPPGDFFVSPEERKQWIETNETKSRRVLEECRETLIRAGVERQSVE
ncbi:MAG TPA: universal stress protein, partial [Dissulfurispiraceae bacterium]|nr:universal stress protein [Dissulfurispiraceae bacterium]